MQPFLFCNVIFHLNTVYWVFFWVIICRPTAHPSNSNTTHLIDPSVMDIAPDYVWGCKKYFFIYIFPHLSFLFLWHFIPMIFIFMIFHSPKVELLGQTVCMIYIGLYIASGPPELFQIYSHQVCTKASDTFAKTIYYQSLKKFF